MSAVSAINNRIILVDDCPSLTMAWEMVAEEKNINLTVYNEEGKLLQNLADYDKETLFYIDITLGGEMSGIDLSKLLFEKGYQNLYLITGMPPENYPSIAWIKGVSNKEPPF